jgi:transposase
MKNKFSPELRERAVRMVADVRSEHDSEWSAIESIAEKIGCVPETLRAWVRRSEKGESAPDVVASDEKARLAELERENRELRRANEILRLASAYFAQAELDRRQK